ncbi:MAG: 3-phosphoserine/phosphohydroxythreonine transaminase [Deltaproteobacteria bacterium]|nr:3-phosphoserine/phosphohydroxythreonine transaminase [Deltaproteobacteria bacterium]
MAERLYNFSAGPAMLPVEVLETVRDNLINYHNTGLGIMEMSHRSSAFEEIINSAESKLRAVLDINEDYHVLFMQGGATTQFSMVPMNISLPGQKSNYLISGIWAEKAIEEAAKFCDTHVAGSSKDIGYASVPMTINPSSDAAYLHFTSNNTIVGTQYPKEPEAGDIPLVCDASSDFLHKKIEIKKYALLYAGAQKNLGPAGVTIVILRKDLWPRSAKNLPILMNYNTLTESKSMYNTPPTLAIYVVREVLNWIETQGGLAKIEERNRHKAKVIYDYIDSTDFYQGTANKDSRSLMNITFRMKNADLEKDFIAEAKKAGFVELKGHRFVGGLRASVYNAFPEQGCTELVKFMQSFAASRG